jgi:hypothetical protein
MATTAIVMAIGFRDRNTATLSHRGQLQFAATERTVSAHTAVALVRITVA